MQIPISARGLAILRQLTSLRRFVAIHSIFLAMTSLSIATADEPVAVAVRSDGHALDRIFADQHLDESGLIVVDETIGLADEVRFERLRDYVLGAGSQRRFRITADFASPNHRLAQSELAFRSSAVSPNTSNDGSASALNPVHPKLISPAIELVQVARSLGKLDSLRDAASQIPATSPVEECHRLAFQSLIAIAENDIDAAKTDLGAFFDRTLPDESLRDATREAALVCLSLASTSPDLYELTRDVVFALKEAYKRDTVRTDWHRHLYAIDITPDAKSVDETKQWSVVTRSTAFDHGMASPRSRWQFDTDSVRKLTSHSNDYLYFASPLTGDFAVEADATGFGYREAHLFVGGLWTGLVYNHKQYLVGNVRRELYRNQLQFPFTDTHSHGTIRTRVAVQDHQARVSLNGYPVADHNLVPHQNPWLAVRSMFRVFGGVDDLTIAGEPIIPDTIEMAGSPQLLGWYDYYQAPGTNREPLGGWIGSTADATNGEHLSQILSRRDDAVPQGSADERLLVYARPMLEDGFITYDFYYGPGSETAHPAIGRTAFLLSPSGVDLHRITDGKYERSTLRPDNASSAQSLDGSLDGSSARAELPLTANSWNRVRLEIIGDTVHLQLNDTPILEYALDVVPNDRTFGLFHYADRSTLRVRNPRWTGNWPKQLPSLDEQRLAGRKRTVIAADAEKRAAHVAIAANERSITDGHVMPLSGDFGEHYKFEPDGIFLSREGSTGYKDVTLSPQVSAEGDFDFTVSFEDYRGDPREPNIANLRLAAITEGEVENRALVQLITARDGDRNIQCMKMVKVDGEERRHYFGHRPNETTAGRLRLSRRGDRIYYLIAENDSSIFQVINEEEFSTDPIGPSGFRTSVQIQNANGRVQARITGFDVRAEKIDGLATLDAGELLGQLNAERDKLPVSFSHNFAKSPGDDTIFYQWGDFSNWDAEDGGLVMTAPGSSKWTSVGTSLLQSFGGDFDVRFNFHSPQLLAPESGRQTQVYLQLELADRERTQLSSMLSRHRGHTTTQAQARTRPGDNWKYDTFATIPVSDIDFLRIARRADVAYIIAGNTDREFVVGERTIGDSIVSRSGLRIMLHTGHIEGTSTVLAKSIEVRSQSVTSVLTNPPARAPSVFESIINLFD